MIMQKFSYEQVWLGLAFLAELWASCSVGQVQFSPVLRDIYLNPELNSWFWFYWSSSCSESS